MILATSSDPAQTFTPTVATKSPITPPDFVPPQNANQPLKPKKRSQWKLVVGGLFFFLLLVGGGAAYWLTQNSQDLRQQADGKAYGEVCSAGTQCASGNCAYDATKGYPVCAPAAGSGDCVDTNGSGVANGACGSNGRKCTNGTLSPDSSCATQGNICQSVTCGRWKYN